MGQAVTCVPPRRLGDLPGGMGKGGSCIPRPIQGGLGAAQDLAPTNSSRIHQFLAVGVQGAFGEKPGFNLHECFCVFFFFFGGIAFALNFSSVLLDSIRKK